MNNITLAQIEEAHAKVAQMIKAFKAQAPRQLDLPVATITLPSATITLRDGERYAGAVLIDGKPAHHLVLLAPRPVSRLNWGAAQEWAWGIGGTLPTRFEAALLYANLRDEFDQKVYHWTDTKDATCSAWAHRFLTGFQTSYYQSNELLACAIRRLPI